MCLLPNTANVYRALPGEADAVLIEAWNSRAESVMSIYTDEVKSLADFRRWLEHRQQPPGAGTDTIGWLNPKQVMEKFAAAMAGER